MTVAPSILVLILASGRNERLHALARMRPASALPFGGKYRIIDFALSNCVHSGLNRVGVLTQFEPLSLQGHIGIGRAWDLDRRDGGIRLLQPYVRQRETNWYRGTADALVQNRNVIADAHARHVLVMPGDQVFKMDFAPVIQRHESRHAALTIITTRRPDGEPGSYVDVETDAVGRVQKLGDGTGRTPGRSVSTSIYLFRGRELARRLDDPSVGVDLLADVIRPLVAEGLPVYAESLDGYWREVTTIDAYYDASMDLLRPLPPLNLHDPDWHVYTPSEDRAPSLLGARGDVTQSLVAHGCRVEGVVRRSILFPGVSVGDGATVEDAIVMHDTRVLPGAKVRRSIVDKGVRIGEGAEVGLGDGVPHREHPRDLGSGITVVGKAAELPAGARIGTNTLIEAGVRESDFAGARVPAGSTVGRAGRPLG